MESIKEIGIINPLRVRAARKMVDGVEADAYEVIAGGHRLRAANKLGLETVPCIVVDDDELHVELAMIDENLCRADLTPAERARATGRRKLIYEKLHPETAHGGDRASRKVCDLPDSEEGERFTKATAKVVGRSERAVQLDAERGENIAPDVIDKIRGTHLDTGVYLDSLKKIGPNEQRNKVLRDLAKPRSAKRAAAPKSDQETEEEWMAAIMRIWNRGAKKWRERFLEAVDTAVMDAA
jgi:ParB-like chromosome segregation protein Spo0J